MQRQTERCVICWASCNGSIGRALHLWARSLAYAEQARMSSRFKPGSFTRMSSAVWPTSSSSKVNLTARRVPWRTGWPERISGSTRMGAESDLTLTERLASGIEINRDQNPPKTIRVRAWEQHCALLSMVHWASRESAISALRALALRVAADCIDHGTEGARAFQNHSQKSSP